MGDYATADDGEWRLIVDAAAHYVQYPAQFM